MKSKIRQGIPRWTGLSTGLVVGSLLISCGADKTNPDTKSLDELKNAKSLSISETGTGTARLTWVGTNGEDSFTGYNIYGAKVSDKLSSALDKANITEGIALQLVGTDGEPREEAKSILQLMSYNGTDFETPDTTKPKDEDVKFQYFPIYTVKDVFPTCLPKDTTGTGVACETLTADGTERTFFGTTTYDVKGLVPGSKYCFFVLSTLKGGKTVAMTTSEMACITPMVHATDLSFTLADDGHQAIDLKKTRAACTATSCPVTSVTRASFCGNEATSTDLLCIEDLDRLTSGVTRQGLTGGQFVSINDLGYYEKGFSDEALPKELPKLTYDASATAVAYGGGYAISGQTLPILANHMYVVANRADASDSPASFIYDLYYAKSATDGAVSFEVRVAK